MVIELLSGRNFVENPPQLLEGMGTAGHGDERLYRVDGGNFNCLFLTEYRIDRKTKKGCWIEDYGGKQRFVIDGAMKRFAYPTKIEAMASFIKRKNKQIQILSHQLEKSKTQLNNAKNLIGNINAQ